jgi:hypothetical protein
MAGMAVAGFLGCKGRPQPTDLPQEVVARRWVESTVPDGAYLETDQAMSDGLAAALEGKAPPPAKTGPIRPLNILALSAGGKFGAYTAGVLAGWECAGGRPKFDVVTGVSSGAVIAVFAFLGPQYDSVVKKFFTESSDRDLFAKRPLWNLPRIGSLASPKVIKGVIDSQIHDGVIDEIRVAHLEGRRLYLATLGIQSKREVIWDVGAIACSGRTDANDLVRKIVLAAVSIPVLLPVVEFDVTVDGCCYKEAHCDGGSATQIFMKLANHQATAMPGYKWLEGSKLYIIAAGKLLPDPTMPRLGLLERVSNSVSSSLYALYRAELCKLYVLSAVSGMHYHILSLDPCFKTDPKSTKIDPEEMRALYKNGFDQAASGPPWRKMPPGGLTLEESTPRTGTGFTTIPKCDP